MPLLSKLTPPRLKPAKPSGANPSVQHTKPNYKVLQHNAFFEERIIDGEKHGGNCFIERTKQNRHGNRIASKRLPAEKILVEVTEFETFGAEEETRFWHSWHPCLQCVWGSSRLSRSCSSFLNLRKRRKCKTVTDSMCCCWRVSNPLCAAFYALP